MVPSAIGPFDAKSESYQGTNHPCGIEIFIYSNVDHELHHAFKHPHTQPKSWILMSTGSVLDTNPSA